MMIAGTRVVILVKGRHEYILKIELTQVPGRQTMECMREREESSMTSRFGA